jgi:nitrate reductase cytochrome c-type subunit
MKRTFLPAMLILTLVGCTATLGDTEFTMQRANTNSINPISLDFETTRVAQAPVAPPPTTPQGPAIPHPVAKYLPITPTQNNCLTCHDRPADGKARAAGQGKAMPPSHYAKAADGKVVIDAARYDCGACHAPKPGVEPAR